MAALACAAAGSAALATGCGSNGAQSTCSIDAGPGSPEAGGDGSGGGSLTVGGTFDPCPTVTSLSISPNELDVGAGGAAVLTATAVVPDGRLPIYTWSATSGTLDDPHAAMTTFRCSVPALVSIAITASNAGCSDHLGGSVTCRAVDAGADAAEADDAN